MKDLVRLLVLARPVRGRLLLAVALGAATVGAGLGLMGFAAYLISRASQQPPILTLTVTIVAVRFFGISRGVFRYLERLVGHDAAFRVLTDVRARVVDRLADLAPTGLPAFRSGDLLSRIVADVDTLQELYLRVLPPFAIALVAGGGVTGIVAWFDPLTGLVVAAGMGLGIIVVPLMAVATGHRAERAVAGQRGELTAGVVELVEAVPELTVGGTLGRRLDHVAVLDAELRRSEQRVAGAAGVGSGLTQLVVGLMALGALVTGTAAVRADRLDGVVLAVVVLLPLATLELLAPLPMAAQHLVRVRAAGRRLFAVLDAPLPVREPADPVAVPSSPHRIVVEGVAARWAADGPIALGPVDLVLEPGRRVALVGPSGSGKSTLAAVLLRFLDPAAGRVLLSGTDTRQLAGDDVRRVVGLLSQHAHVFDTTVAENLRFARPGASDAELRRALQAARLLDWVDAMPQGIDTRVGEHGTSLSGGQRQRLVLARLLVADFPFVVLDEPAEHLDTPTADALLSDQLAATSGRGTLIISHRLSGLQSADEIVVLDQGQVAERGGHGELLARGGWYARRWQEEQQVEAILAAASPTTA